MRYYVLTDIHGFYDKMIEALEESGYYKDEGEKKIVVCGDLFDRGSREGTLALSDWTLERIKNDEIVLVRGNHEDLIEELVLNLEKYADHITETHHYKNDTTRTLCYFTDYTYNDFFIRPEAVRRKFYNTDFYKKILPFAVKYFETNNYVFVHGWIPCDTDGPFFRPLRFRYDPDWRNATEEKWWEARWFNGMEAWSKGIREPGKTIVCGHFNSAWGHCMLEGKGDPYGKNADQSPFIADGIIALDACTAESGIVNCVVLEE